MTDHVSHSQLSSYTDCGERYRLERIEFKPQAPAWWTIAGSTVHQLTEFHDKERQWGKGTRPTIEELTEQAAPIWAKYRAYALKNSNPQVKVKAANKGKEDEAWWLKQVPIQAHNYLEWVYLSSWHLIEVELKVEAVLGASKTPFVGYIDRVFVTDTGELAILDLKSGGKAPSDAAQLGTYATLYEMQEGTRPSIGYFFHTRTVVPRAKKDPTRHGTLIGPFDLSGYTSEYLGQMTEALVKAKESEVYVPRPSYFCGTCDVNKHCFAYKAANPMITAHGPVKVDL